MRAECAMVGKCRAKGKKRPELFGLRRLMLLASVGSLRQQHVARVLDRARDGALVLCAEARVLAGQDLARVGHKTDPGLRIREGDLRGCGSLLLLLGGAHVFEGGWSVPER